MMGHRFFSSSSKISHRQRTRRRDLARRGQRNNLRLETLESRLAMFAATLDLVPEADSGFSDTDNITNATEWQVKVSNVAEGATINLYRAGELVTSGTVATGESTLTFVLDATTVGEFLDGTHSFTVADSTNTGDLSSELVITKDTVAEAITSTAPTAGVAGVAISYDAVSAEEAATGTVYSLVGAGVPTGATIDPATGVLNWTPAEDQIGSHGFSIQFTDLAGNAATQAVNITIAPPATVAPDLDAASDSGALDNDNITKDDSLEIVVANVMSGATVKLYRNGEELAEGPQMVGNNAVFTIDVSSLTDGEYEFTATQEVAGIESAVSAALTVTLDTTVAPLSSTPPTTAALNAQLTYNAEHAEEGAGGAKYSLDGAPAGATIDADTGVLTWTPSLSDLGETTFKIIVTDAAGNSSEQQLTIDVAPPAPAVPDLDASSDSGELDTDNISNDQSLQIVVNDVLAGASVTLYRNGVALALTPVINGTTATFSVDLTGQTDATHSFTATQTVDSVESAPTAALSVTIDTNVPAPATSTPPTTGTVGTPISYNVEHAEEAASGVVYSLQNEPAGVTIDPVTGVVSWTPVAGQEGVNAFKVLISDLAGNTVEHNLSITVSAAPPVAPSTPDLQAGSDSGSSSTDNLTNSNSLLIDVGGLISGAIVKLYRNGTLVNTITADSATETFTVDMTGQADGAYDFTARQEVGGVESAVSGQLSVTRDATVPVALTSTPPTSATIGTPLTYDAAHPEESSSGFTYSLVDAPGNAAIDATTGVLTWTPAAGDAGVNAFQVKVTDAAGNERTQSLSVAVAPAAPVVDLDASTDSGIDDEDEITNASTWLINVTGVVAGASVRLYRNDTLFETLTASGASVTFTVVTTSLTDGTYTFRAEQTFEGQASPTSSNLVIVKDTTNPASISSTAPTTANAGAAYTYDAAHAEEGQPGFKFSLVSGPSGASINADTGAITWTPANNQLGANAFQIRVTDAAGNVNTQNFTVTVTDPTVAAYDLVAFAKALTAAGVIMYGAAWCPHCTAQKALFQDGADFIHFVEVTNFDATKSLNAIGIANNITTYPTWVFQNGTRLTGEQTLEAIAAAAGITIPTGVTPSIAPIDDVTLLAGSPLHIPLNGYDPNGGPLTYEISIGNPNLLSATVLDPTNKSLRIKVENWGDIVVYLFEDEANNITSKIITLANNNTYDNTIFHRVIGNFMIQGGDPNGNGLNDEGQPEFDDQFNLNLQHNRSGVLSMAKSDDDTNTSQFFITDAAARHLDFNHSVFGQLTEGDKVRDAINNMGTNSSSKPVFDVKIQDVEVFVDTENGMLRLKAANGVTSGTTSVTVTVRDAQGNSAQESFNVTIAADTANTPPFLNDIAPIVATSGTQTSVSITSTDLQNNAVVYDILSSSLTGKPFTASINSTTGQLSITPNAGFVGTTSLIVRVRSATPLNLFTGFDEYDSQEVTITVNPSAPTGIDLLAASDTGMSNTDNITNATSWQLVVSGVIAGAMVQLQHNGQNIGQPVQVPAGATTVQITIADTSIFAQGEVQLTAVQTVGSSATSTASVPITITKDTVAPPALDTSSPVPTSAIAGVAFVFNANHANEGQTGYQYSLTGNVPAGATIHATTGVISWTPTAAQVGAQAFTVQFSDAAGNIVTQNLNISVISDQSQLVQFIVRIVDADGNEITEIEQGEDFYVQVFIKDNRANPEGVFSAYTDLTYNQSLVSAIGSIDFGSDFANVRAGNLTTPGLVDEAGGVSGITGLGEGEFRVFTVRFTANQLGNAAFATNPADDGVQHPVLLFNLGSVIPDAQVTHASKSLSIIAATGAVADDFTVVEDSTNNELNPLSNDTLPSGVTGTLTISEVTQPTTGGTVSISPDNTKLIFTPTANFAGEVTFTYTITNGAGFTDTATVRIGVTNTNDPPTANDDTFTVSEDAANTTLNVLTNDSFAPDPVDTLTITAVSTGSAGGTITIASDGKTLIYKPAANFNGTETFTYTITDTGGVTDTATVTVTVNPVNDNPTAGSDTITVVEDSDNTTIDVLANDSFAPDVGETLTITNVSQGNKGGTITIGSGGLNVIYKPAANFFGTETFTYVVSDGNGGTATGTVTVTVTNVNDNPTATNDTGTTIKNTGPLDINVLANDSSAPDTGETLTITAVTQGSRGGTITIINNGTGVRYQHAAGVVGTETFTYTISDGNGGTATATVTVTVQDFIPSDIAGFVYIDANRNGVRDAGEQGIAGVTIMLTGTDFSNAAVNRTFVTLADGSYKFINVAPGSYSVTQIQPALMVDGAETMGAFGGTKPVNDRMSFAFPENSHLTGYNFGELGREARFVSMRDFLTSTPSQSAMVAVTASGSAQWATYGAGWTDIGGSITASLNAAKTHLVIALTNLAGQQMSATIPLTDTSKIQYVGGTGTMLYRLLGPQSAYGFTVVTSGQGEPQGEAQSFASYADNSSTSASDDSYAAPQGEAPVVDAAYYPPVIDAAPAYQYDSSAVGASLAVGSSSNTDDSDETSTSNNLYSQFDAGAHDSSTPQNVVDSGSVNYIGDGSGSSSEEEDEDLEAAISIDGEEAAEAELTTPVTTEQADAVHTGDDESLSWVDTHEEAPEGSETTDAETAAIDAVIAEQMWLST